MAEKIKLNDEQREVFSSLQKFVKHPAADTFVLKGYAGTGKTFLMQHFANWLAQNDYKFHLLASTGRAATVLRGKSGLITKTVHSQLYFFSGVDGIDDEFPEGAQTEPQGQLSFHFPLREGPDDSCVYIIDESSMLSNIKPDDAQALKFGSGELLSDLFTYARKNKIVFVGDPGQLPPIFENFSPALDMDWLQTHKRIAVTLALSKIERIDKDNDILVLASMIRNMMTRNLPRYPKLPASRLYNVEIVPSDADLFQRYRDHYLALGPTDTIAIARSNRMVNIINRAVRRDLYKEVDCPLQEGDILLVTANNYSVPFTNGDIVSVCKIEGFEVHATLHFQRIKIKHLSSDIEHEILISLDVLYGRGLNFTKQQFQTLMIEFHRKMKKLNIARNSDEYKDLMRKDPYLNCLRAKYGYAVTCHKAQGGEWKHVYLFLENSMFGMPHPELLRWWYTAVTRAKERLYLANHWWIE